MTRPPHPINLMLINWNCLCVAVMGACRRHRALEPFRPPEEAAHHGGGKSRAGGLENGKGGDDESVEPHSWQHGMLTPPGHPNPAPVCPGDTQNVQGDKAARGQAVKRRVASCRAKKPAGHFGKLSPEVCARCPVAGWGPRAQVPPHSCCHRVPCRGYLWGCALLERGN